ncbi:hypothetical protein [Mastigocoleus sp. MO_188.B34]|uniref:hypothetical protein n=1 Tax=Mastigocoleus sp. MO_188.B34 TaxID=3036635 RepID=UPI00260588DA|nr:hypothetical protein [Mastigocoleus sp. MO_188.B34]MDJ0694907.1 hypothetical protein [Mastigocoleus sp. MO_188.B34]
MANYNYSLLERLIWTRGIPSSFWVVNHQAVRDIVQKYNLRAMTAEELGQGLAAPLEESTASEQQMSLKPWPWPFPGGLKIAHVHYGGQLFLLNQEQWAEFSGRVISDLQAKLDNAQVVTFDSMLDVSEAVDTLSIQAPLQKK